MSFLYPPSADDTCGSCSGKCLVSEKKTFEVHVEQGMKAGSKVVLRGEAGCSEPGLAPGDVILVIMPKEHATFKRVNIDLIMQVCGAWCGEGGGAMAKVEREGRGRGGGEVPGHEGGLQDCAEGRGRLLRAWACVWRHDPAHLPKEHAMFKRANIDSGRGFARCGQTRGLVLLKLSWSERREGMVGRGEACGRGAVHVSTEAPFRGKHLDGRVLTLLLLPLPASNPQKKISLADALCGATFRFKHLDGRVLTVSTPPGEVIKPDTFKRINDEGMPIHGRPFMKGNLYIHFTVEFPDRLDAAQVRSGEAVEAGAGDWRWRSRHRGAGTGLSIHEWQPVHALHGRCSWRLGLGLGQGGEEQARRPVGP